MVGRLVRDQHELTAENILHWTIQKGSMKINKEQRERDNIKCYLSLSSNQHNNKIVWKYKKLKCKCATSGKFLRKFPLQTLQTESITHSSFKYNPHSNIINNVIFSSSHQVASEQHFPLLLFWSSRIKDIQSSSFRSWLTCTIWPACGSQLARHPSPARAAAPQL